MEFGIINKVFEKNKRDAIYVPIHKKWVELSKVIEEVNGIYTYEIMRLDWRPEFDTEGYLEDNFDNLYVKPANIIYPEPEKTDEEFGM